MSLADYYNKQLRWRDWRTAMDALPEIRGKSILDLGCGAGDQAALLTDRGARVVGVDTNEEVLDAATARKLLGARFINADLRSLPDAASLGAPFDGLWSSFSAAYFVDLEPVLKTWASYVRPGGWIALIEIDDFFGHEPLAPRTRELLGTYVAEARASNRYDFYMGRKLSKVMSACGIRVDTELELADAELTFNGNALPDVLDAWTTRLEWMTLLKTHCGSEFEAVRDDFLACLGRADHQSTCRVMCCIGRQ